MKRPTGGYRRLSPAELAKRNNPVEKAKEELEKIVFLYGEVLEKIETVVGEETVFEDIVLGPTEKKLNTKLGKEALGYFVLSQNAPASIYRVPLEFPPSEDPDVLKLQKVERDNFIILKASATVTVTLWVFSGKFTRPVIPRPAKPKAPES